jgi:hypothetical protein
MAEVLAPPARPTAIYYADEVVRAEHLRWPVPRGSAFAFYTTWNMVLSAGATLLALAAIPWMRRFAVTRRIAAFSVVPVMVMAMASIVCTTIVSQLMLAFNVTIEGNHDPDRKLALGVDFVKKMLAYNFIAHVLPLVFVVLLGFGLACMPAPATLLGRCTVFLVSTLLLAVFALAWLMTPVEIEHTAGQPDITVVGWEKIEYVYRSPPSYYFYAIYPVVALLVLVVSTFGLFGGMIPTSMSGI